GARRGAPKRSHAWRTVNDIISVEAARLEGRPQRRDQINCEGVRKAGIIEACWVDARSHEAPGGWEAGGGGEKETFGRFSFGCIVAFRFYCAGLARGHGSAIRRL